MLAYKILKPFHRLYKYCLSPLLGKRCRFYPDCSDYCLESIKKHGFLKGSLAGLKRLAKCHPWHPGGYDPVEK